MYLFLASNDTKSAFDASISDDRTANDSAGAADNLPDRSKHDSTRESRAEYIFKSANNSTSDAGSTASEGGKLVKISKNSNYFSSV